MMPNRIRITPEEANKLACLIGELPSTQVGRHLTEAEFAEYAAGVIPTEHVAHIDEHLASCEKCEEEVLALMTESAVWETPEGRERLQASGEELLRFARAKQVQMGASAKVLPFRAKNGNGLSNDQVARKVARWIVAGVAAACLCVVPTGDGVQSEFGGRPWVAILGGTVTNTNPGRRTRTASEFVNGNLPTSLDGVSVTVNGKPAYVYYLPSTRNKITIKEQHAPNLQKPRVAWYMSEAAAYDQRLLPLPEILPPPPELLSAPPELLPLAPELEIGTSSEQPGVSLSQGGSLGVGSGVALRAPRAGLRLHALHAVWRLLSDALNKVRHHPRRRQKS